MIEFRDRKAKGDLELKCLFIRFGSTEQGINPFEHSSAYADIMKTETLKADLDKMDFQLN